MMLRSAVVVLLCVAAALPAHAQTLREQCVGQPSAQQCERVADAAVSLPARMAILAAGGNPLAGTTGTLGMRLPGSPRVSAALRGTLGRARMPDVSTPAATGEVVLTAGSVSLDAGIGLFDGFNLAPTMGGFGSLDLLLSAGLLRVPEDDGLRTGSSFTWAAGVRAGILRESFTAPGVSVAALYRRIPDVRHATTVGGAGPLFDVDNKHVISVRATVGKRVVGLGLTGGVGWDRVRSDVDMSHVVSDFAGLPLVLALSEDDVVDSRLSFFGSASYTTSVFNFGLELGWQQHGDRPANAHRSTRRGGIFGSAAIRLTI